MNKSDWIINTTGLLIDLVPGYAFDTAQTVVETYLAGTGGGWVPDDVGEPLGEGAPDSGDTPSAAAATIATSQIDNTKTVEITVPINVTLTYTGSFPTGTSTADIVNAGKIAVEGWVTAALAKAHIEYNTIDWDNASTVSRFGGNLSTPARVAVQTQILSNVNLVDPAAVAVAAVRYQYNLGSTWMTYALYTRDGFPIVAWIKKYADTTYATVDPSYVDGSDNVTYPGYLVYMNPVTLAVQTILTYPESIRTAI